MVYTPGVARVCMAIHDHPDDAYALTIKKNTVAVVTDGSAVLGLGDIGPAAALPVMEGKCALFKEFAGVDAFPLALDTTDPDEIVDTVTRVAPAFGGINLEDIGAPRCFEIERRLREQLDIPVFHGRSTWHGHRDPGIADQRAPRREEGGAPAEGRRQRRWRSRSCREHDPHGPRHHQPHRL